MIWLREGLWEDLETIEKRAHHLHYKGGGLPELEIRIGDVRIQTNPPKGTRVIIEGLPPREGETREEYAERMPRDIYFEAAAAAKGLLRFLRELRDIRETLKQAQEFEVEKVLEKAGWPPT